MTDASIDEEVGGNTIRRAAGTLRDQTDPKYSSTLDNRKGIIDVNNRERGGVFSSNDENNDIRQSIPSVKYPRECCRAAWAANIEIHTQPNVAMICAYKLLLS